LRLSRPVGAVLGADWLAVVTLLFVFLGGSLLAALWVLAADVVPVALVAYLVVAVLLLSRVRRAASIWEE
jgi:membrane protein implicated in regulation of membrane protease activity